MKGLDAPADWHKWLHSSDWKLFPSDQQLFDEPKRFVPDSTFEKGEARQLAHPNGRVPRSRLVGHAVGAQLHAGVVGDLGQILHGAKIGQPELAIGRVPT